VPARGLTLAGGIVYHVINRSVRRAPLLEEAGDYRALLDVLVEAQRRNPVRLLAYCLMPNHFHMVLWPLGDGDLSKFMHWFTMTHSKRWHAYRGTAGTGSVYQGRFKALPIEGELHFLTVCRYVEGNPLRAGLVSRAEHWPWSSLSQRCRNCITPVLETWPILPPEEWISLVNGESK
jgi:REP-associated tyrosine transposase